MPGTKSVSSLKPKWISKGAVLCDEEISGHCKGSAPLIDPMDPEFLKGAAYDLRVAKDGIILPSGRRISPNEGERTSPIVLQPGETVLVTTLERIRMPRDLIGNMSVKADLARAGILALTGLIIDPGYGANRNDGRLHFPLANLGGKAVVLEPGKTRLASVQFLRLDAPATRVSPRSAFAGIWDRRGEHPSQLGFIKDLRDLEDTTHKLETRLEQQARATDYLIAGGVVLLAVTLLSLAVAAILSLGRDSKIISTADAVIPNDRAGQVLGGFALFGLAAIAFGLSSGLALRRSPPRAAIESPRYATAEAWRFLRAERRLKRFVFALGSLVVAFLAVEATVVGGAAVWWVVTASVLLIGGGTWFLRGQLLSPISPGMIDDRARQWSIDEPTDEG